MRGFGRAFWRWILTAIPSREARSMAMYVPESPWSLCRILRLEPDIDQIELMESLARRRGLVDERFRGVDEFEFDAGVLRAALMVVLWRTLRVPGSRATILAPSAGPELAASELGHLAMAFLAEVCKTKDAVLCSISRTMTWHCIEFGDEPGWAIRFVHNAPPVVAEAAARSLTGLVIDAGDASSALGACARELEAVARQPRGLVIRLW